MNSHASLSTGTRHIGTLYFVALLREELGRRIKDARNEAGLSQQDLASAIGLKHAQDVSRYERGLVEVPSFRIDRIAEATGRPRSYFTRDPAEPEDRPATDEEIASLRAEVADVGERLDRIEILLRQLAEPQERPAQA